MAKIEQTVSRIAPLDQAAMAEARARQDTLTKPRGSLGRLEELATQLAGIQARSIPRVERKAVITMAADHGVAREGVSAYPVEVTGQMVANFLAGAPRSTSLPDRPGPESSSWTWASPSTCRRIHCSSIARSPAAPGA